MNLFNKLFAGLGKQRKKFWSKQSNFVPEEKTGKVKESDLRYGMNVFVTGGFYSGRSGRLYQKETVKEGQEPTYEVDIFNIGKRSIEFKYIRTYETKGKVKVKQKTIGFSAK